MTHDKYMKLPPIDKSSISSAESLVSKLSPLIGIPFKLTHKTRTDGSNLRKLISKTLYDNSPPKAAEKNSYEIMPPKRKGVPRILLEFVDTYIVTSGNSYNMQVWNRVPNSENILIQYKDNENSTLSAHEVRFICVKITEEKIDSIVIMTPQYIEEKFGKFGKPTVKYQLIISDSVRLQIINEHNGILFEDDTQEFKEKYENNLLNKKFDEFINFPNQNSKILRLSEIKTCIEKTIHGYILDSEMQTKNRGQILESKVLKSIGYTTKDNAQLYGDYPDIPNQLLEVKVQDSPTVDLGRYTPQLPDEFISGTRVPVSDIRYLIALTNKKNYEIEGIVLMPGTSLGKHFTFIPGKSVKYQTSIPMIFFTEHSGKCVYCP